MNKDDADALALRAQTIRNATDAVRRAEAAMDAGHLDEATNWIRRARRLVPQDATLQILFASIVVHTQPQAALSELRALTHRLPWHREAATALAAVLLQAGHAAEAAANLARMLRLITPSATPLFTRLAGSICDAAGVVGWIGMDGEGRCHAMLAPSATAGTVRLLMDGQAAGTLRLRPGQPAMRALPDGWRQARSLSAYCRGDRLLGDGLAPERFGQMEGFATAAADGSVSGWVRPVADPDTRPAVFLQADSGPAVPVDVSPLPPDDSADGTDDHRPRWGFQLASPPGRAGAATRIVDAAGRDIWGSPLVAGAERESARLAAQWLSGSTVPPPRGEDRFRPLPASLLPDLQGRVWPASPGQPVPCDVVLPVYAGLAELELCLASLQASLPVGSHLVLVDDGSPDPAISARLAQVQGPGVTLLVHDRPRGFPAAVNAGLAHLGRRADRDVVILNADTVVPRTWLERLSAAAHADATIGSCTPLTNDGTLVSYPEPGEPAPMPDAAALAAMNDACWQANGGEAVAIPTGVGFCMLMKGACLAEVGRFREDAFAQGYGEENDWCLRAAHLGWWHVAAPGVFVAHSGGRSFGAAKALLMQRNGAVLERLHPGYAEYVAAALAREPLLAARRRIDRHRLLRSPGSPAVAIVTHDSGGGVARSVARRCATFAASGTRPIVLSPAAQPGRCGLSVGLGDDAMVLPNLSFDLPGELPALAGVLREAGVESFEIHHLLNHDPSVARLPAQLGVPYDVFVHDYGHWCPRITLTSRSQRYCGEPLAIRDCEECVADLGSRYGDEVTVRGLREASALLLGGARRIAVSCEDVATRLRRQFRFVRPDVVPWEDAAPQGPARRRPGGRGPVPDVHVLVAGAIGIEKGYDVLLGCARDAARRGLPLRFTVVGHTIDDERLMVTGRVFVTGRFDEHEGLALVEEQDAALGFVPSVCPETWCYTLSLLWQAGLPVLAFELGAQGQRIVRSGSGWLLPVGISPAKINDTLVSRGRETLQATAITFRTGAR